MGSADDLQLDLDGIDEFAIALDGVTGQLDGTDNQLGDDRWLAGDKDLCAALADFTTHWRQAAPLINSYAAHLSSMAHDCVDRFRQADTALAKQVPPPHGSHVRALMD